MSEVPSAEGDAPTTDCPICGRSAKDCNDSHAKGWDGCCMACDEVGRLAAHRLRMTPVGGRAEGIGLSRPCANDAPEREVPAAPPTGSTCVLPPASGRAESDPHATNGRVSTAHIADGDSA